MLEDNKRTLTELQLTGYLVQKNGLDNLKRIHCIEIIYYLFW